MRILVLFVFLLSISPLAHADQVTAAVSALQCNAVGGRAGATSVSFSGDFMGAAYMNVTNVNPFGIPFTQQARIESSDETIHDSLRFQLHLMLTNQTVYLKIFNGTSKGLLSSSPGDDEDGIQLNCVAKMNRCSVLGAQCTVLGTRE